MPYMKISSCPDMTNYVNIYASYELTAIGNVTTSTGIHIFLIIGICFLINVPVTLYVYDLLHATVVYM